MDLLQFYSKKEEFSDGRENATEGSHVNIQLSAPVAGQESREVAGSLCKLALQVSLSWLSCCLKSLC